MCWQLLRLLRVGLRHSWLALSDANAMVRATSSHLIMQVVTVGYGDIVPATSVEQCIAIAVFIVGILFFGILLGSIGEILQRATKSARRAALFREKMAAVEAWLRLRAFPKSLRNSIRAYYAEVRICV